ncbi:MAG: hypothetical protein KIT18_00615 [Burkholderiales bacterium]|nr:hypothetical protein [Burkholderiales bacterium]
MSCLTADPAGRTSEEAGSGVLGAMLEGLLRAARALGARPPRQERLSGIHNPFGRAAAFCDPWQFLEVCESAEIVDRVARRIGSDVVLWDSELYLDAAAWVDASRQEGRYWPADPLSGLVADIALETGAIRFYDVCRMPRLSAVVPGAHYIVRYMPATSLYNRDPLFASNRIAMEASADQLSEPPAVAGAGHGPCGQRFCDRISDAGSQLGSRIYGSESTENGGVTCQS